MLPAAGVPVSGGVLLGHAGLVAGVGHGLALGMALVEQLQGAGGSDAQHDVAAGVGLPQDPGIGGWPEDSEPIDDDGSGGPAQVGHCPE